MTDTAPNDFNTPWTLHFDRDGTEDFGIICDAEVNDLVASHLPQTTMPRWKNREFGDGCFWLPEDAGEEVPLLVRQMLLMKAAPSLLTALVKCLALIDRSGVNDAGPVIQAAVAAINEATEWPNFAGVEGLAA